VLDSLGCLRSAGLRVADLRRYLELLARGDAAAAEQRELFDHHAPSAATASSGCGRRLPRPHHRA
jgi:hypothetical protein